MRRHKFLALELSLHIIRVLRPILRKLRSRNRKLHSQLEDALTSITMNLGEGNRRVGRTGCTPPARPSAATRRVAGGSAGEVHDGLRAAVAHGYLDDRDISEALELLDRELGMIWGLTN